MIRGTGVLDTAAAAYWMNVTPATIRKWRQLNYLDACGGTPRRPVFALYDVLDAAIRADPTPKRIAMRDRARQAAQDRARPLPRPS